MLRFFTYINFLDSPQQAYNMDSVIVPTLHIRKQRHREVKQSALGHNTSKVTNPGIWLQRLNS